MSLHIASHLRWDERIWVAQGLPVAELQRPELPEVRVRGAEGVGLRRFLQPLDGLSEWAAPSEWVDYVALAGEAEPPVGRERDLGYGPVQVNSTRIARSRAWSNV